MKCIHLTSISSLAVLLFVALTTLPTRAYDHDDHGWIDEHHHHHAFIHHNGHRGYWDHDRNGVRIFVNV